MSSILKVDTLQDVNGNAIISSDGSGNLTPNTFTGLTISGNLSVDGGTIKLDGNYPVGTNNVALGDNALSSGSLSGNHNIAIGKDALEANTSGTQNVAVGESLFRATTAQDNVAIGYFAGRGTTTGSYNIAIGTLALGDASATTSEGNVAVGYYALNLNTADNNTAVGRQALEVNTTGTLNTAVGYQALYANTTGTKNISVGYEAGKANTTSDYQCFVGYQAGLVTTGNGNTFIGNQAGYQNTTGTRNTYIGVGGSADFVGGAMTTGSKNTIIGGFSGNQGGLDIRTFSNNIVLSDGDGNPRMRVDGSGIALFGNMTAHAVGGEVVQTTSTGNTFTSKTNKDGVSGTNVWPIIAWNSGNSGDNGFIQFGTETTFSAKGSITYNRGSGIVAYNTTSDYRAKDIISPITDSGSVIDSVPVYIGRMNGATQECPMFIAHETPAYAHTGEKDAVDEDGNPVYQQMDASALIPVMWAEIQSLRKRLADAGIT